MLFVLVFQRANYDEGEVQIVVLATWVICSGFGNERASLCYLQMNMRPAENLLFLHYQQRVFRNEFSFPVFQGLFAFQAVAC